MNGRPILLLLTFLLSACDSPAAQTKSAASASASGAVETPHGLAVGQRVIAATSKTHFRDGTIVSIEDSTIVLEYGTPDSSGKLPTSKAPIDKAWLPAHRSADLKAGDYAVCRIATTYWVPCHLEGLEGDVFDAQDSRGTRYKLERDALLQPDEATRKNIEQFVTRERRHRQFDKAFAEAGSPRQPEGWKPAKGDRVVAHLSRTSWYGATLLEVRKNNRYLIDWDGDTWDPREMPLDRIAPQPSGAAAVTVGQFVIVKPRSETWRWDHSKVVAVNGDDVEVAGRNERKRKVKATELIPIVPDAT